MREVPSRSPEPLTAKLTAKPEKRSDIRVLLVTGAGASRNLGIEPVPLMADWARHLRDAVERARPGLADVIGLRKDIDGEVFERCLGDFLQFALIQPLLSQFQGFAGRPPGDTNSIVQEWVDLNQSRVAEVIGVLNKSMYEMFAKAINPNRAQAAYNMLDTSLGGTDVPKACATTNYDLGMELGFSRAGYETWDHFVAADAWGSEVFDPGKEMPDWKPGTIPIHHLHGAVGWYRNEGAVVRHPYDQSYNPTLGSPVFLPPDPVKNPLNDATVATLWADFDKLLLSATHILVLGHSLNDPILVEHLNRATQAQMVVAAPHPERAQPRLPQAAAVKMEFGASGWETGWVKRWADGGNAALEKP